MIESAQEAFYGFVTVYIIFIAFFISIIFIFVASVINRVRRTFINNEFRNSVITRFEGRENDISKKKLAEYNIDSITQLKEYLSDIFIRFENAYNNLDYNIMKELSTSSLFNKYYTGVTLDLKFGYKRIISDITKEEIIIYDIHNSEDKQIISSVIGVSYHNYKINKSGDIISGDNTKKVIEQFEVIFERGNINTDISKCPHCGAEITGTTCNYCRKTIIDDTYRISSIRRIIANE